MTEGQDLRRYKKEAYECSQRLRYKSKNGSNDPFFSRKVDHMESKRAMIAAVVFSMLNGARDAGDSCEREVMGGRLRTLTPQPITFEYSVL